MKKELICILKQDYRKIGEKMKKGRISIIIAVYNTEKYIEKCLKSVMNQTYKDIEIIVVNDCSKDKSLEKIQKLQKTDNRIILIDNEKNLPEIEALDGPVYTLKPHTAYLASIKRKVKIPKGYTMLYLPRSTLLRSFISVQTAVGDPGFYGTLMFMIYNHGEFDYKIKSGDRIAQAVVFPVEGSGEYNGSYQEEE